MAIDPRISLNVGVPQTAQAINIFENALINAQNREIAAAQEGRAAAIAPIQQQAAQQGVEIQRQQIELATENRALQSIASFSPVLKPQLEAAVQSGDVTQVTATLNSRLDDLQRRNLPPDDTIDAINLVAQGDIQGALDGLNSLTATAQARGLTGVKPGDKTASQKDFLEFQRLQSVAQISGKPEDQQAAQQFGAQAGFVRPTAQQEAELKVETAQKIATQKSLLEGKSAAVKAAVNKGAKAFDQIAPLGTAISNYDDAIAQLDAGATTGFFASLAPSFKAASIKLDNVVKRLGLDVVGSTTFGALSESELKFALEAAIPTNLQPAELKEWLIAKRDAQKKVKERVEEAASFLSDGTHTLKDWIEFDKARQLNIKNAEEKAAADKARAEAAAAAQAQQPPPTAASQGIPASIARPTGQPAAPAGVQIGRFTVVEVK